MITLITTQLISSKSALELLETFASKNLQESDLVSCIHILAEGISDKDADYLRQRHANLHVVKVDSRPSFKDLIEYAVRQEIKSEFLAFTNADIFWCADKKSASILSDLTHKFPQLAFTLTRRDDKDINRLLSVNYPLPEFLSSDAWIFGVKEFKARHINLSNFSTVYLGKMNLENVVNTCFSSDGFQFCNAGNIVKAIHLDKSVNDYGEFEPVDILKMVGGSSVAAVNAFSLNSILPISVDVSLQYFNPSEYKIEHIKTSGQYIYCDLPSEFSDNLWASLLALISISKKYKLIVYLVLESNASAELNLVVSQLSSLFPLMVSINSDKTEEVIRNKLSDQFIVVSHPGVITSEIINFKAPIFVLSSNLKQSVYNYNSFGIDGFIDLAWDGAKIDAWTTNDKSKYLYSSKLQLITCIFKSKRYIDSFLDNSAKLSSRCSITHSLIGCNSDSYSIGAVLKYLSSGNDGFYVNLDSDPGLYECWNTLIRLSNEEFISNANPDDLRIDSHAYQLISALESKENQDILVASSNVFPIFSANRFDVPATQIAQNTGAGWFSDTPDYYGLEDLFESDLDANGLVKPRNVPHCAPIWRRTIHAKHGYFDEKEFGSEADYGLWVKYASDGGKFRHINQKLSGYYIDEHSYGRSESIPEGRKRIISSCAKYLAARNSNLLQTLSDEIIASKANCDNFTINIHGAFADYGFHRFENNRILESFLDVHCESSELTFIWFLEKYFVWGNDQGEAMSRDFSAINKPWIGVLHVPPLTPKWAGNQFSDLYSKKEWNQSLKYCKGLICLTDYMMKDIKLLYPGLKHYSLKHPIASDEAASSNRFNPSLFFQDPKIILSGYWLRQHKLFYEWEAPIRKIHLLKQKSIEYMNKEFKEYGSPSKTSAQSRVHQLNFVSNDKYDLLLKSSIFFLYLHDASANNAVLECINSATPFISNRHPAIEEYVGSDYPLFMDSEDLSGMTFEQLHPLVLESHLYLKEISKSDSFLVDSFKESIINIAKASMYS